MKRKLVLLMLIVGMGLSFNNYANAQDLEGQSSASYLKYVWNAYNHEQHEEAINYADACVKAFAKRAKKMQSKLDDFILGPDSKIHLNYALNDVATALYVKAESLRKMDRIDEAIETYKELVDNYYFGQCWDPRGWFWKPALVAKEKIEMLESGMNLEFGDYSSMTLMIFAWKALDEEDIEAVMAYTNKCIELYAKEADKMQSQLDDFPKGSEEKIHGYWALNDVATAYFIQGEAQLKAENLTKSREAYQKVIDDYSYAQCWDPRGWFWKVKDGAIEKIAMIDSGLFMDYWDYTSNALVSKAWMALNGDDYDRALGYADKCIQLYTKQAVAMQGQLEDYPDPDQVDVHTYWALNDVATAHYVKGKAYIRKEQPQKAKKEFETIMNKYHFGQCWDPKGWWWRPSYEANIMIESLN